MKETSLHDLGSVPDDDHEKPKLAFGRNMITEALTCSLNSICLAPRTISKSLTQAAPPRRLSSLRLGLENNSDASCESDFDWPT